MFDLVVPLEELPVVVGGEVLLVVGTEAVE